VIAVLKLASSTLADTFARPSAWYPKHGAGGTACNDSACRIMSYHSAQLYLAVSRLIAAHGCSTSIANVDCETIEMNGKVAYEITARGRESSSLAWVLSKALGDSSATLNDAPLSLADAKKLLESAYRSSPTV